MAPSPAEGIAAVNGSRARALAAFFGGLVQLVAGFFALAKGDLFPAAFMTSYGAFWFSYVALVQFVVPRAGAAASQAVTIFLIMWTIITLIVTVATLGTNWFVFSTFIVSDIALILACISSAGSFTGVTKAAGTPRWCSPRWPGTSSVPRSPTRQSAGKSSRCSRSSGRRCRAARLAGDFTSLA